MTASDPALAQGLAQYQAAAEREESILVRPSQDHPGLAQVVHMLQPRSALPLLVTDLRGNSQRLLAEQDGGSIEREPTLAFFTSGSTGSPKCVVYTRDTVDAHAGAIAAALELARKPQRRYFALTPPGFAYGLSIVNSHLHSGVGVTFCESDWGLNSLNSAIADVEAADDIALYLLPQHVPLVLSAPLEHERISRFIVAGGRLSGSAAAALAERCPGARLTNMYGQAELGPRLSMWQGPLNEYVEGLIGEPLPGVELELRATEHEHADGTEASEILARTPFAMSWALPAPYDTPVPGPTPRASTGTRDLAIRTPDGSLVHRGRADHVLNVAGTKVDMRRVTTMVEQAFTPIIVRADSRPARVGGDMVPVIEIIPQPEFPLKKADVKRLLHPEFGALVALFEIHIVDRLRLKESGK
ncbi:AMP-binding protein [Gephyromycinifex aptenodytis]|uniref:AMP-binding protein n=1 Tax=Gephyromycinifex aptenodytis TaxID=2716227 RepID=UPI0014465735|nr:class I adenylate-forming enzyme family protein [Gephyromycinifex aptenodytis]